MKPPRCFIGSDETLKLTYELNYSSSHVLVGLSCKIYAPIFTSADDLVFCRVICLTTPVYVGWPLCAVETKVYY